MCVVRRVVQADVKSALSMTVARHTGQSLVISERGLAVLRDSLYFGCGIWNGSSSEEPMAVRLLLS